MALKNGGWSEKDIRKMAKANGLCVKMMTTNFAGRKTEFCLSEAEEILSEIIAERRMIKILLFVFVVIVSIIDMGTGEVVVKEDIFDVDVDS